MGWFFGLAFYSCINGYITGKPAHHVGVVVTYIIRQIVSLLEEYRYETVFQIQGFCQSELWRQHSGLVSVIVILDRVLKITNFWQFLLIWWTTDPASLAKRGLCSSHPWT